MANNPRRGRRNNQRSRPLWLEIGGQERLQRLHAGLQVRRQLLQRWSSRVDDLDDRVLGRLRNLGADPRAYDAGAVGAVSGRRSGRGPRGRMRDDYDGDDDDDGYDDRDQDDDYYDDDVDDVEGNDRRSGRREGRGGSRSGRTADRSGRSDRGQDGPSGGRRRPSSAASQQSNRRSSQGSGRSGSQNGPSAYDIAGDDVSGDASLIRRDRDEGDEETPRRSAAGRRRTSSTRSSGATARTRKAPAKKSATRRRSSR